MGLIKKVLGPRSKYDKTLPYTYEARIDALSGHGAEPLYHHYFSDTICGLIECLADEGIDAKEVQLFGVYQGEQIALETEHCTDAEGDWLARPEICRSLEAHYQETLEERYKGHREKDSCSYEDRDRNGIGPY